MTRSPSPLSSAARATSSARTLDAGRAAEESASLVDDRRRGGRAEHSAASSHRRTSTPRCDGARTPVESLRGAGGRSLARTGRWRPRPPRAGRGPPATVSRRSASRLGCDRGVLIRLAEAPLLEQHLGEDGASFTHRGDGAQVLGLDDVDHVTGAPLGLVEAARSPRRGEPAARSAAGRARRATRSGDRPSRRATRRPRRRSTVVERVAEQDAHRGGRAPGPAARTSPSSVEAVQHRELALLEVAPDVLEHRPESVELHLLQPGEVVERPPGLEAGGPPVGLLDPARRGQQHEVGEDAIGIGADDPVGEEVEPLTGGRRPDR